MKSHHKKHKSSGKKSSGSERKPISNISPGLEHLYGQPTREVRRPKARHKQKPFQKVHAPDVHEELNEVLCSRVAFGVLREFERTGRRLDLLVREAIRKEPKLSSRDKGWVTRLAQYTAKWQVRIDYVISRVIKADASGLDMMIRILLRMATLQVLLLHKAAKRTREIIDATLPRPLSVHGGDIRNFIKELAQQKNVVPYPNRATAEGLAIYTSHPLWMVQRWIDEYGFENAQRICEFNNGDTHLTIRANTQRVTADQLLEQLKSLGYSVMKSRFAPHGLYISGKGELFQTPQFAAGLFEVQEESSQLFAEWCGVREGMLVVDACAGAGGKSLAFSAHMQDRGRIVCGDVHHEALEELRERATRNGCSNIEIGLDDVKWQSLQEQADVVLVDAPCSGLGTISRNPDIRIRLEETDVENLHREQSEILERYSSCVRPGGSLIYATCTLLRRENEEVVGDFLRRHAEFHVEPVQGDAWNAFATEDGYFSIRPFKHNLGGFFGCKMRRSVT